MNNTDVADEIKEANLTYMLLAQQMLREDKASAMFRLGISREVGDILEGLTPAQVLKLVSCNTLLCRFRFDDKLILDTLTNYTKDSSLAQSHAAILMAGRAPEKLAA